MKLWNINQLYAAAQDKRNRRPVSRTKRGLFKASGKWADHTIAAMRKANVRIANAKALPPSSAPESQP